jgi:predicted nucleotidyltransferase
MNEKHPNSASQWRIALAQKIGPIYASIPAVRAVVLVGGMARGRGDRYSDLDIAVFWDRAPDDAERRAAMAQFGPVLGTPVVIGDFAAHPVFDHSDVGLLWEEAAFIGGDARTGFKIDVNHRTVAAMEQILEDVTVHHDVHGHKLEVLYSIQHVVVLHGEALVTGWQARASVYSDALAQKLVELHLSQLRIDLAMHLYRGDLLPFYQAVTAAEYQLMGALLALNHIYRPELKRLRDLCDEMTLKPDHLAERLHGLLRDEPARAAQDLHTLVEEVLALVQVHLPEVDVKGFRAKLNATRQPFDAPPVGL